MIEIKVFKKCGKEFTCIFDESDYDLLKNSKLIIDEKGHTSYVAISEIYKRKVVYVHRLLLNAKRGDIVDHINGNGLDNRRCNLRICSQLENSRNRKIENKYTKNNSSGGFKGVVVRKDGYIYAAIVVNKKRLHLGNFKSVVEAAKAYDQAARHFFSQYACLNFPEINEEVIDIQRVLNKKIGKTSKFIGVYLNKDNGKYRASVRKNGKIIHCKDFENELEAAKYRDNYIKENNLSGYKLNFKDKSVDDDYN